MEMRSDVLIDSDVEVMISLTFNRHRCIRLQSRIYGICRAVKFRNVAGLDEFEGGGVK